jgi:16S rRNA A1518/A1519 N6-dimethyltransferase RsmA/KsgA/DIM1 with predicted DNA glycosylase/AP lyase activity
MFAKKSLGQHFLMHRATAERIADASGITPADTALEIGPGTGILTTALLQRAGKVIAVEADHELIQACAYRK